MLVPVLIPSCALCVEGIHVAYLLDKNIHLFKYLLPLMAEQEIRQMKKVVKVEGPEKTQYVYEPR